MYCISVQMSSFVEPSVRIEVSFLTSSNLFFLLDSYKQHLDFSLVFTYELAILLVPTMHHKTHSK